MVEVKIEYLKVIVISFEFLILLIGLSIFFFWPELATILSKKLLENSDLLQYAKWLRAGQVGLVIWTLKESRRMILPKKDKQDIFQDWPDYWKFKIHCYVALFYTILFLLIPFIALVLDYKITKPSGFILLAMSLTGQIMVLISIYFASIRQSELLTKVIR